MSQVQITASPSKARWLLAMGSAAVLTLGLVAWLTGGMPPGEAGDQAGSVGSVRSGAPVPSVPAPPPPAAAPDLATMQAELDAAGRALSASPQPQADALVRERPEYVSPMEWMVLKGVSAQKADPERELTRMVHFLRFHKLLERWQALPAQADVATRQQLAASILADLPNRVAQGDVSLTDARAWMPRLVAELEPDAGAREGRLASEWARVASAAPPPAR